MVASRVCVAAGIRDEICLRWCKFFVGSARALLEGIGLTDIRWKMMNAEHKTPAGLYNIRLIIFHKHPMSARLNFMQFSYGGVCAFRPLPKLASLVEKNAHSDIELIIHPSTLTNWAEEQLDLEQGTLQLEVDFYERVEVPKGEIAIYLAGIKGNEPPDGKLRKNDIKSIDLMACVGVAPVEMLLLQKAYRVIMGG